MSQFLSKPLVDKLKIPLLIYFITAGIYFILSGPRLKKSSSDNHYVYLADCLLKGRFHLIGLPPHQNDWARITELTLKNGRKFRGMFLNFGSGNIFETTQGDRLYIPPEQIRTKHFVYYVSFPWLPALLMMPFVAIWGMNFNDVIFTIFIAALNPVLIYFILRRLVELKYSRLNLTENLWLVSCFAFGTLHFYASILGQVWYSAQIIGVTITCLYILFALNGQHPFYSGLCLGLGFITRTPILFSFPLVVGEILLQQIKEKNGGIVDCVLSNIQWRPVFKQFALLAIPITIIVLIAFIINELRFDNPLEFGHYYLNVRWSERIQRWGLFNYHFVARNLAVFFVLLPRFMPYPPYLQISMHGMSLFLTTPIFSYLIWPRRRSGIQTLLYLSCFFPLLLHLFYQNTGWVQFGYRFSLDYTVFLIALLAVGDYPLGLRSRILIIFGIAINTFGAITFQRFWQFYWDGIFPIP